MSVRYIIHGGKSLRGSWSVNGSPLAAVGAMAAALLTKEKLTITNVPHLFDLDVLIEELRQVGVMADWTHNHEMTLLSESIKEGYTVAPSNLIGWSPVLLGSLLARTRDVKVVATQSDMLDDRLATVVSLVHKFGGQAHWQSDVLLLELHHPTGVKLALDGVSAEQTLLAVLLGAVASGESYLTNAVIDPEIEDVFSCLRVMGVGIDWIDSDTLQITPNRHIAGATHELVADRYEAALVAVMAVHSCGDVLIKGVKSTTMMSFLAKLQQMGVSYNVGRDGLRFWHDGKRLKPVQLAASPYPGLGRDWLSLFLPLLCGADGESVVETDAPEELSGALRILQGLGAEVYLRYGQARVFGPSKLVSSTMKADGFITALTGMIAAIGSSGVSELDGVEGIDGRFEMLPDRLSQLGVKITRVEE